MNEKIKAWIKLSLAENIGYNTAKKIIDILGDPIDYVGKGRDHFEDLAFLTDKQKDILANPEDPPNWGRISRLMERYNINFVSCNDPEYPARLKEIFDPPLFLFYRGTLNNPADERSIAVVGTRKPDNYGKIMAKKITEDIVTAGFTVVSGLAYGIDSIAHEAALQNDSRTIAVMGTGCETIYPSRNMKMASAIMEKGALVSEYLPGCKSEKWFFSGRNRIISGLTLGTLVVQGKKSSGALITAKYALEQNRDIFALPGDINRQESEGPNYLITKGAKLVTAAKDILEEYDLYLFKEKKKEIKLTEIEQKVLDVIKNNRPEISSDNIVIKTGLSVGELSAVLLSLEMKNLVFVGSANMVSSKE